MRKVVIHRAGSYNRLKLETHPDLHPADNQVLVDVDAIGVNYADVVVRMGLYASARTYVGWPITPGFEFAGRVIDVGRQVDAFRTGDEVFGVTRFGAYATQVVVPQQQLVRRPETLTVEQAAAFPTVFLTAYAALFLLAKPRRGDLLLIHSAAGGVGSALIQLSRVAGCKVIAVVGASHKVRFVEQLDADHVIDKSAVDLWAEARRLAPAGYDMILDANGASTLRLSYAHLRPTGKLVIYGFHSMLPRRGGRPSWIKLAWDFLRTPRFNPLKMTTQNRSVLAFNLSFLFDRTDLLLEAMGQLLHWLGEGQIQPPSVTTYPFEEVAWAHRDIESGNTTGKLVLLAGKQK